MLTFYYAVSCEYLGYRLHTGEIYFSEDGKSSISLVYILQLYFVWRNNGSLGGSVVLSHIFLDLLLLYNVNLLEDFVMSINSGNGVYILEKLKR